MESEDIKNDEVVENTPTIDERSWAMGCHLIALVANFVGPLIFWLVKRESSPFIDEQGKEALNFQLSIMLYTIISYIAVFFLIGVLLMPAVLIFDLVCVILAATKAYSGVHFRYPACIRFIK